MKETSKIYYKVVSPCNITGELLNKDQPDSYFLRTSYEINKWTVAKNNSKLFVFENMSKEEINFQKKYGKKVFKCVVGDKIIKGNGINYRNSNLRRALGITFRYCSYEKSLQIITEWFWNKVEKNLKAKKKYSYGMEKYMFDIPDVVLVDKVKLLEEL